jgi:D-tyrosyl-tRNA(Tyr) deacylase
MRLVIQRVREASVEVEREVVGRIGPGLLVLVGVDKDDGESDAVHLAEKTVNLRIFEDEARKMNRSLLEVSGEVLAVSQFTLYGDLHKGRRPSFERAAAPEQAERLFERFVAELRRQIPHVATGRFRAYMQVHLVNDGPVTLILESRPTG